MVEKFPVLEEFPRQWPAEDLLNIMFKYPCSKVFKPYDLILKVNKSLIHTDCESTKNKLMKP